MSTVTAQIVRRLVAVATGPETPQSLLSSIGISEEGTALEQDVDIDSYYDVLERAAGDRDGGLPFRYARSLCPVVFGAMGLAFKTAADVREALERLIRYVLVITDSLDYELREDGPAWLFVLRGRPHHRRGARLANEAALAAVTSILRQITTAPVNPASVWFQHPHPGASAEHEAFFACPLRFEAPLDALRFDAHTLAAPTRLADEGLSSYLLAQLDSIRDRRVDRSLEAQVKRAVSDALCDGPPPRAKIARRLGMSERTLHRKLASSGLSFRTLVEQARREAAESLLISPGHSIADVAFFTGFSEQSAFHRAFKRWVGQTPQAYRQHCREQTPA